MLWAIMDEGALRRPVGDAEVMRAQFAHLMQMAQNPKIKVLVVPAIAGAHVGLKVCGQVFDTLRAEALPPRASLELVTEMRDTWT